MANEHFIGSVADLFASEVLANEFLLTLAARDGSVLTHPCLQGKTGQPGSNVIKVPHIGYGADLMTAATEGSDHANVQLTDTSTDVTLAMYALRRNVGDIAKYVAAGKLGAQQFAAELATTYQQTIINAVAGVIDGFTATVGTTTANLTWAQLLSGKGVLGVANAQGPLCAILHPQQWADLDADALGLGYLASTSGNAGIVNAGLGSYKGRWFNIDIFTTSHVVTANAAADRAGAIFAPGAIVWADAMFDDDPDPNIANLGRARLERVRVGNQFQTSYVMSMMFGTSMAIDAAGVSVITDA